MNFWENVVAELEFQGKTRKELAAEIGFDASNIGKGEKNGNIPAADTALKIAFVLGVSLESLLNMELSKKNNTVQPQLDIKLCKKYYSIIQKLNEMPDNTKNLLCKLISEWKDK
ncbi:MAG: helix-turn-helix transcriptional regulator [Treponema sp.]|nr:helix-turn-helix transcriptional regulator [Treponema sp.]